MTISQEPMWRWVLLPLLAYLIGSIPWGLVLSRVRESRDIRRLGSGNIGATNVARQFGVRLGSLTLVGDCLKGTLPVLVSLAAPSSMGPWKEPYACLVALAAFLGHLYPVFTRWKGGGKGVATAAGGLLVLSPGGFVVSVLVFALIFCISDRISAASLVSSAAAPCVFWGVTHSPVLAATTGLIAIMIWVRHRDNILRLLTGREPRFRPKRPS
ncbi:glycerol-3-phosphate 1-O-acyltransferase PlsY [Thermodesulfobacteriota bacterium]